MGSEAKHPSEWAINAVRGMGRILVCGARNYVCGTGGCEEPCTGGAIALALDAAHERGGQEFGERVLARARAYGVTEVALKALLWQSAPWPNRYRLSRRRFATRVQAEAWIKRKGG